MVIALQDNLLEIEEYGNKLERDIYIKDKRGEKRKRREITEKDKSERRDEEENMREND